MDLSELQHQRDEWVAKNFPPGYHHQSVMGATEEVLSELLPLLFNLGKLNHHYIKMEQGIRGSDEEHLEAMKDALGDCVVFLAGVASGLGIDFGKAVQETWAKVSKRNWVDHPVHGGEVA